MRKIVVFYAWQSDTAQKFNRYLIDGALRAAAKRVTDSIPDVEVIVDSDTSGVPGTPPVTETLLGKIAACDIFIPDVSFVAETAAGKSVPNPNVMLEYGYALHAKTYTAMMPVMNTVFGPPQQLPFDMGHLRHPIQFHVEPTAGSVERSAVRQGLSKELEEKLRLQIAATQAPRPAPSPFVEIQPKNGLSRFRARGESIGRLWHHMFRFGDDLGNDISLVDGPTMLFRLMPTVDPGKKWPTHELKQQARPGQGIYLLPFVDYPLFDLRAEDGMGICSLQNQDERETILLAFAFETGEVWSIDTQLLAADTVRLFTGEVERLFTNRLQAYARFLGGLGLAPPYRWIAGLEGVKGRRLQIPPPQGRMQIGLGPECLSDTIFEEGVYDGTQKPSGALNSFFTAIFDKCGIRRRDHLPS